MSSILPFRDVTVVCSMRLVGLGILAILIKINILKKKFSDILSMEQSNRCQSRIFQPTTLCHPVSARAASTRRCPGHGQGPARGRGRGQGRGRPPDTGPSSSPTLARAQRKLVMPTATGGWLQNDFKFSRQKLKMRDFATFSI